MRRFEPVAGFGGILLLVSLFLTWFEFDLSQLEREAREQHQDDVLGLLNTFTGDTTSTAWQSFTVIDVLLALIALLAIAVPVVSLLASGPAKPIAAAVLASAFGWVGIALVAFRLLDPPFEDVSLRYGAWLALAGAILAWVGSWLSMRDESTPGAKAPDVPRRAAPPASAA